MATKHQLAGPECPNDSMPNSASNQPQNGDNVNVRINASGTANNTQMRYGMTCLMNLAFMEPNNVHTIEPSIAWGLRELTASSCPCALYSEVPRSPSRKWCGGRSRFRNVTQVAFVCHKRLIETGA